MENPANRTTPSTDEAAIAQIAAMLAASENGACCSGEDPPEPTPTQWEEAREWYATRCGKGETTAYTNTAEGASGALQA